jgi:hypothetical protein
MLRKIRHLSCPRINQTSHEVVKSLLALIAAWLCALSATTNTALAQSDDFVPGIVEGSLPEITAREFDVTVTRRSSSNRVYLLEDIENVTPKVGRIILLRKGLDPVMAFRVLRHYPDTKQLAATRVRRYANFRILDSGEQFSAIEKLGDLANTAPSAEDMTDLNELEGAEGGSGFNASTTDHDLTAPTAPIALSGPPPEVLPYDPELDVGNAPPPSGAIDSENSREHPEFGDDEEDAMDLVVDEVTSLDPNSHWFSGGLGLFRADTGPGGIGYFAGGGVRYGLTLGKMLILRRPLVQDSLVAEGGLFFYKILNFSPTNDAYNVLPLIATVRYNIHFGEGLAIFFYGGVMRNNVTSTVSADEDVKAALASPLPAGGGGMLFRVGPNWDARIDLGIDAIGLSLMLRF